MGVAATKNSIEPEGSIAETVHQFDDRSSALRDRGLANAMSVDVEDYFQVSAFDAHISRSDWPSIPARLPQNVERILQIFDDHSVRATFFTLGWVCEHLPQVVRTIVAAGHELASHGHDHVRVGTLGQKAFERDIGDTRKRLEDVGGVAVVGYRAPSFSIGHDTMWAYDALAAAGYRYSSSVFPISHDHYGVPNAPRFPYLVNPSGILEIPMSSINQFGRNWPCSGGGWFRLMPFAYSKWAIARINTRDRMPAMFYFHPWEIDAEQPRIENLPARTKFRHYVNLHRFESRLARLTQCFAWDRIDNIYLREL